MYRKLTVVLPHEARSGDVLLLEAGRVRAFLSYGSSAFAGKKGCYGQAAAGEVRVAKREKGRLVLAIEADFELMSPLEWAGECEGKARLDERLSANITDIQGLDAWMGRPASGDSPFEEANVMDSGKK
jgi:hypothetical protein